VLLAISDTGCGMDELTRSRIFEPFFTTKDVGKGTGMGLATVHGIVKQLQGHVTVYSEVGHGTVFKLHLPRAAGEPAAHAAKLVENVPDGAETVLLVEDDEAVRAMASRTLSSRGYRVLESQNGIDALRIAQNFAGPIHLLITDVVMPQMGGPELAEKFRLQRPQCRVLFLSGYAGDAVFRHGVLESEHSFLPKPFTPSALIQKIRSILDA
jgi:two-component system cell cycle sensor histidine kinase/response regulator CckA